MDSPSNHEVTQLLKAWSAGDEQALDNLMPLVYDQLRRQARRYMAGECSGHNMQATALVNEVYLRLVDCNLVNWQDRAHFFALSARLMRRILVDFARSSGSQKRGSGVPGLPLEESPSVCNEADPRLEALDDALRSLAAIDERKSKVVELRFFGGLSIEETADVLKVSIKTVGQDWRLAKVWLLREMSNSRGT